MELNLLFAYATMNYVQKQEKLRTATGKHIVARVERAKAKRRRAGKTPYERSSKL